jgi:hypothetical protein
VRIRPEMRLSKPLLKSFLLAGDGITRREIMCVAATNTIRILAGVLLGATIGFTSSSASAQTALSGRTGQPIQIGKGSDPEKDTVGFICLSQDVNVTGSTVIRSQDGKWTIAPVGHASGDAERDTVGYVQK